MPHHDPSVDQSAPESVRIERVPLLADVRIWSVQDSPRLWSFWPETYLVGRVEAGSVARARPAYRYRRQTREVCDHDISVWEPGESLVQTKNRGGFSFQVLEMSPEATHRCLFGHAPPSVRLHFATPGITGAVFDHALRALLEALLDPATERLEAEGMLHALLASVFEFAAEGRPFVRAAGCERAVQRVKERLMDDYSENVSLDELAHDVGLTKYHLARSFRARTGMAIHRYQQHVRVTRAIGFLRQGVGAAQVARLVGCCDQSHLCRLFRRTRGVTPGVVAVA